MAKSEFWKNRYIRGMLNNKNNKLIPTLNIILSPKTRQNSLPPFDIPSQILIFCSFFFVRERVFTHLTREIWEFMLIHRTMKAIKVKRAINSIIPRPNLESLPIRLKRSVQKDILAKLPPFWILSYTPDP